ncbi:MAG: hypothetical protein ACK6EB_04350, partial [Planctomyces sp.]
AFTDELSARTRQLRAELRSAAAAAGIPRTLGVRRKGPGGSRGGVRCGCASRVVEGSVCVRRPAVFIS